MGKEYAGLSKTALYYIGGILKRTGRSTLSLTQLQIVTKINSWFEAPVILAYSARNRSASCRIP